MGFSGFLLVVAVVGGGGGGGGDSDYDGGDGEGGGVEGKCALHALEACCAPRTGPQRAPVALKENSLKNSRILFSPTAKNRAQKMFDPGERCAKKRNACSDSCCA